MPWVCFSTSRPRRGRVWPRVYRYKRDAVERQRDCPGAGVVVCPLVSELADALCAGSRAWVFRCERDSTVFAAAPARGVRADYDPLGDRSVACPTCGRRYILEDGEWFADRVLTVLMEGS